MKRRSPICTLATAGALLLTTTLSLAGGRKDEDRDREMPLRHPAPARMMRFEFSADSLGATPGGAKDIASAREHILAGEVPHPATFTPEGLFSEYDLPLPAARPCVQILCLSGAATRAELLAQPEVRTLAQLGFASNLDART